MTTSNQKLDEASVANILKELTHDIKSLSQEVKSLRDDVNAPEPLIDPYDDIHDFCSSLIKTIVTTIGFPLIAQMNLSNAWSMVLSAINSMAIAPLSARHLCNKFAPAYMEYINSAKEPLHHQKALPIPYIELKSGFIDTYIIEKEYNGIPNTIGKTFKVNGKEVEGCKYIFKNFQPGEGDKFDLSQLELKGVGDLNFINILMDEKPGKAVHLYGVEPELLICLYDYVGELKPSYFEFTHSEHTDL